jgi:multisubunit Na+/H+ antiporter MnhB subunit
MTAKAHRHPILGFFAGLFFGFGLALILFVFGVLPVTVMWLAILTAGMAVLGVVLAYVAPVRGRPST